MVSKEKFESLHTNLDGRFIDPKNLQLQPLRITSGWKVALRNAFFDIDPTPESVRNEFVFNCTMLVLEHKEKNRLLDVGWSDMWRRCFSAAISSAVAQLGAPLRQDTWACAEEAGARLATRSKAKKQATHVRGEDGEGNAF